MSDEITRVFDRLGGIEANQIATFKAIEDLREDVKSIESKLAGTNGQQGLCTRVLMLEDWKGYMVPKCKEHMAKSARRTWAVVSSIFVGLAVWLTRELWK